MQVKDHDHWCDTKLFPDKFYIYNWLPLTKTLANSNQNRSLLDFRHTFTVNLPSVARTSINWTSRPLEAIFVSLQVIFHIILPSIARSMSFNTWQVKTNKILQPKTLHSSLTSRVNFFFLLDNTKRVSSVQVRLVFTKCCFLTPFSE